MRRLMRERSAPSLDLTRAIKATRFQMPELGTGHHKTNRQEVIPISSRWYPGKLRAPSRRWGGEHQKAHVVHRLVPLPSKQMNGVRVPAGAPLSSFPYLKIPYTIEHRCAGHVVSCCDGRDAISQEVHHMKIGRPKPKGIAVVQPARKVGDPKPEGYKGTGRPTKYRPEYCQSIIDFFTRDSWELVRDDKGTAKVVPKDNIPTLIRWCLAIGVPRRTIYDWIDAHPEFADAHDTAMELQKAFLMESGIVHGSGGFASFMLKCVHGMQEPKQDPEDKEDGPIQRVVVEVVGANQHKGD